MPQRIFNTAKARSIIFLALVCGILNNSFGFCGAALLRAHSFKYGLLYRVSKSRYYLRTNCCIIISCDDRRYELIGTHNKCGRMNHITRKYQPWGTLNPPSCATASCSPRESPSKPSHSGKTNTNCQSIRCYLALARSVPWHICITD